MTTTQEFAIAHGLCGEVDVPAIEDHHEPLQRTSTEIAQRAIVLHVIAAAGFGVERLPILEWLKSQNLFERISPAELAFLQSEQSTNEENTIASWRVEAEWALLWVIGKVESLGLPTQTCDTGQIVNEIMPMLGDPIDSFLQTAKLRSPGEILAEEDRHYNLHCYVRQKMKNSALPVDLNYGVLWQRCYALHWATGEEAWDEIENDT